MKRVQLGSVCKLVNGKAFKPSDWAGSGVPIVRIQNLNGSGKDFNYFLGSLENQVQIDSGELLLAWSGTPGTSFGAHIWRGGHAILNQHIFRCELDTKAITSDWAKFAINKQLNRLIALSHGGVGLKHVTRGVVEQLEVPLPSIPEQRRIAEILDRAEALRAKRRAAIAQLDILTQSIFLDLFGDPEANRKGLKTAELGSLCRRITDGTHQPPTWAETGHPFLFVSNIVSGEINFDTQKFISEETHESLMRRCPIEAGDVLYSTVGSYGVPVIVRTTRKFAFQRHIAHLKPDAKVLDSEFLRAMLSSPPIKRQADRMARGVAQKTLNLSDISRFLVFCPPIELQRAFTHRVSAIARLRTAHHESLMKMDVFLASLQYRAFRGELLSKGNPQAV